MAPPPVDAAISSDPSRPPKYDRGHSFPRERGGSFHQVSHKHLDRYLDEFEFRYNNRKNPYLFRDTITRLVTTDAMPYEQLTA
jgi:ISXO2 transposase-like protein